MRKKNKLNSQPTKGYRSKWEYQVSRLLASLKRKFKFKSEYEPHKIEYTITKRYIPDWIITLKGGKTFYIEAKGAFLPLTRQKMDAVLKCNPDLDIRMLFNKHSKSNQRWCERRGVPYAVGEPPKEWFDA